MQPKGSPELCSSPVYSSTSKQCDRSTPWDMYRIDSGLCVYVTNTFQPITFIIDDVMWYMMLSPPNLLSVQCNHLMSHSTTDVMAWELATLLPQGEYSKTESVLGRNFRIPPPFKPCNHRKQRVVATWHPLVMLT